MTYDRTATIQSVSALEASVRARTDTDRTFLSWWVYFLLLSWLTFGIATIYYFIRRLSRVDQYSRRKQEYYAAVISFTDRYAHATGQRAEAEPTIRDMHALLEAGKGHDLKPINALIAVILSIVTLGIWSIVAWYQLNRAWSDRQRFERSFNEQVSQAWLALGITRYPITFEPVAGKDRNFVLYFVLTIVTLGIWGLVWDYKVHHDPDNIYPRLHQVEDTVVQFARAA